MALPDGVTTCTVTAGVPVTHTGAPVKAFVSIEPSVFLVHTATGTPLVDFLEELSINEGVAGQFTLPHTDQAGFQDENGNAYTNWYYTARISYSTPSKAKTKAPKIKVFQLAAGQTLVDLDALPGGAPALPYTAPIAVPTSFNGRTGAITLEDADLPERLSDTALTATYGPDAEGFKATYAEHRPAPVFNRAAIKEWDIALAQRDTAQVRLWMMGSSTWNGANASTWDKTVGRLVQKRLAALMPLIGGNPAGGYFIPAYQGTATGPAVPVTNTGSVSQLTDYGPAYANIRMTATSSLTFTVTGTSAKLWFGQGSGSADCTISIDGGTATPQTIPARPGLAGSGPMYLVPVAFAEGTHTVKVTWVSGTVSIVGIIQYAGDENKGIHLLQAGHGGWQLTDWLAKPELGMSTLAQMVDPHLITIGQMSNDWSMGTQTAAQYKTNMAAFIDRLRTGKPNVPILLVVTYQPQQLATPLSAFEEFRQALYQLADEKNCALVDTSLPMPPSTAGTTYGLYADTTHMNDRGHAYVADLLIPAIAGV